MDKTYKVNFRNKKILEFSEGTTFKEISDSFKKYFNFDILAAKVDNDVLDLSDTLRKKCNIDFFDRTSTVGHEIYSRSARFILILAFKRITNCDITAEHSLDNGIYFTSKDIKITKKLLNDVYKEMMEIVNYNYLFTKLSVSRLDAIKYFKKHNKIDKVNVLKYISNTYINLYRIDDEYDYFYGKMAYETKQINEFKLNYINENGFVLSLPNTTNPECTLDYVHHANIYNKFTQYNDWGKVLKIINAADLNKIVSRAEEGMLINLSEAYYDSQLAHIADEIYEKKDKVKIVLLAGPSSSGKTTTSKKLDIYLRSKGFITHPICLDDFFTDIEKRPLTSDGKPDFESIRSIDVDLFNKKLSQLLEGKKVSLPSFNFVLGKREYNGKTLQLGEKDIIIVEGLHALNDTLTMTIDNSNKYRVYISPLINLNIDDHTHIHTTDIRKLRRIVRDSKTRGFTATDTLKMWPSIQFGERENIYRFQDDVDKVINSSLVYEIGVLKTYVEPLLFNVDEQSEVYPEALRLINFLRNFLPIPSDEVPADSVLREFIGGSCFKK